MSFSQIAEKVLKTRKRSSFLDLALEINNFVRNFLLKNQYSLQESYELVNLAYNLQRTMKIRTVSSFFFLGSRSAKQTSVVSEFRLNFY